jgi:anionic cell wall polymer biosynthesis LytR-Cps2A-Psr (LCP) family protein
LDSRVGQSSRHADANHVLSFFPDSGFVQITSVPRGTYVNCGYPDTSRENYLANYRPLAGREKYLEKLGQLSKCGSIDYYIEFGFSQAIRLLELMGFKDNAVQMLRVLRSRKSFGASDYQRCYNQGQFIRQMILSQIHKADGVSGDILLRGALMLVETNLPFSEAKAVISALRKTEFPRSTDDVSIMLRPKFSSRINVFDFTSDSVRENLYRYIAATSPLEDSSVTDRQINNAEKISKRIVMNLNNTMARAAEKAKQPQLVIRLLRPILEQRIWNQITDRQKRNDMREKFFALLCEAYLTNGDTLIYHRTRSIEESEIALDDIIQ